MGSFMHVQKRTNAVTRAVQIVQSILEERLACEHIELRTRCALRKLGARQGNVALQHTCIRPLLLWRGCAKVHRACRIDRAVVVLRPRVVQVRRDAVDQRRILERRLIMGQGGIGTRRADGIVRLHAGIQWVLGADPLQGIRSATLR